MDELAPEDKLAVARARKMQRFLSQPFTVAQNFTGQPGKYVSLKDTIKGFKMIVGGECDALPEQAFYMVGTIEEAIEKAKTLDPAADSAAKEAAAAKGTAPKESTPSKETPAPKGTAAGKGGVAPADKQ